MEVGDKVVKTSGKPFKCGFKVGTILEFCTNPHSGKPAVRIKEDNSIVDLFILRRYKPNC